ncbi:hypothetical protein [Halalkalibacter wakoensis]|nr:hypothetical protein [Halalkalibacter wakoensis]
MAQAIVTWSTTAADVSKITGLSVDQLRVGCVVRIDVDDMPTVDMRINKEKRSDITGDPGNIQLEIGSVRKNLGTTNADLQRRQQINELYSNGATNIDSHGYQDNADPQHPAKIKFYLDEGLVNINTMTLTYEIEPFRAYSRAIEGGGALVDSTSAGGAVVKSTSSGGGSTQTSSSGGGTTATSSSGGGVATSTQSGGGTTQSSEAGGDHDHLVFREVDSSGPVRTLRYQGASSGGILELMGSGGNIRTAGSSGNHSHSVSIPSHTHNFNVPSHSHDVTIPNHQHTVNIPNHTHEIDIPAHAHQITLPDHTHDIEHGIFELSRRPSTVEIRVDGNLVPITDVRGRDIDIIPYLATDSSGKIQRGTWHEVTITPNDLGRITADIISRLFIQSQIGGTF